METFMRRVNGARGLLNRFRRTMTDKQGNLRLIGYLEKGIGLAAPIGNVFSSPLVDLMFVDSNVANDVRSGYLLLNRRSRRHHVTDGSKPPEARVPEG